MKLSSFLSGYFESGVRARGREYQLARRVRLSASDPPDVITATVHGTETYRVRVLIGPMITGSCTCPYFEDFSFCKHIWAVVLAAEAAGRSQALHLPADVRDAEPVSPDDDDWSPEPQPRSGPIAAAPNAPVRDPRRTSRPAGVPWARALEEVRLRSGPDGTERAPGADRERFIFIVEGLSSRRSDELTLSLMRQSRLKSGGWGKPKSAGYVGGYRHSGWDPVLQLVQAAERGYRGYAYGYGEEYRVSPGLRDAVLPMLWDSGRLYFRNEPDMSPEPLECDAGPAWQLRLRAERSPRGAHEIRPVLRRGDESLDPDGADLLVVGRPGLLVRALRPELPEPADSRSDDRNGVGHNGNGHGGDHPRAEGNGIRKLLRTGKTAAAARSPEPRRFVLSRFDDCGAAAWLSLPGKGGPVRVPAKDWPAFLASLSELPQLPPLEWPDSSGPALVEGLVPAPELSLSPSGPAPGGRADAPARLSAKLTFVYDGFRVESTRPGELLLDPAGARQVRRDLAAEQRFAARLEPLGFTPDPVPGRVGIPAARLADVVAALTAEGWAVFAEGKPFRTAGEFQMDVASGIDWFEVRGSMDFGGASLGLPELLEAVRRGRKYVALGDGTLGVLPEKWLADHGLLLDFARAEGDHLRFSRSQVSLLDAMLADRPAVRLDEGFLAARDKLRSFAGVGEADEPPGFAGRLRPYQRLGLGWLRFLEDFGLGGCLADDMGLGKTVQVLALLQDRRHADPAAPPSLVVVPKSLVFNWMAEAAKFAPGLRVVNYTGNKRGGLKDAMAAGDLLLTTYGTMRRDIKELAEADFDYVVLDEAQAIKNVDSLSAKCARLLRGRRRLAMSGTPVENHLGELWSLMEFLNPGQLGKSDVFRARFADASPTGLDLLRRAVRPILLRRTKEQVAPELPQKTEETLICEMPPAQRALYNQLRDHYRAAVMGAVARQGLGKSKIVVLEALLRLRQAACHPGLLDRAKRDMETAKMEVLLERIAQVVEEGHKALVFSQFVGMLSLVRAELDRRGLVYEYLDGKTKDRGARVERFQTDPKCPLFLISLKAGGLGLNLTAAGYVFILDPWWNPAVEAQAVDRAHRIGQDKPVFAYRLLCRDSIEEKVAELQAKKRDLADSIISGDAGLIRTLTREDLEMLLS